MLQEVVDGARAITASRYAAITVRGDAGQTPDFIVSGLTREEHQGLWDMPGGLGFFEYLSGLREPLRVSDIDRYLKALNMPDFLPGVPVTSLLVAPILQPGTESEPSIWLMARMLDHQEEEDAGAVRLPAAMHSPTLAGTGRNAGRPTWNAVNIPRMAWWSSML